MTHRRHLYWLGTLAVAVQLVLPTASAAQGPIQPPRLEGKEDVGGTYGDVGTFAFEDWKFEPHCASGPCNTLATYVEPSGLSSDVLIDPTMELAFDGASYTGQFRASMCVHANGDNYGGDESSDAENVKYAEATFRIQLRFDPDVEKQRTMGGYFLGQWSAQVGAPRDAITGGPKWGSTCRHWFDKAREGTFDLALPNYVAVADDSDTPDVAPRTSGPDTASVRDLAEQVDPGRALTDQASASAHSLGRSPLASSLRGPDVVSTRLALILANVALAAALVLLVFPAVLFNSTLEDHYDEIRGWFRRKPRAQGTSEPRVRPAPARWVMFVAVALVTGAIYGLVDPKFGADRASVLLVVGLVGATIIDTLAGGTVSGLFLRKHTGERGRIRSYPGALVVAGAGVGISRLVHFLPGYLYGIVGGFDRKTEAEKRRAGQAAALGALLGIVLGVAAWFGWQPVSEAAAKADASFVVLSGDAILATVAAISFQSLLFSMIPIRGLPGAKVFGWNKIVWGVFFGLGAFSFFHVLVHPTSAYTGSIVVMLGLFAAFGIASVAFWGYFRLRKDKPDARPPAPPPPPPPSPPASRRERPLRAPDAPAVPRRERPLRAS